MHLASFYRLFVKEILRLFLKCMKEHGTTGWKIVGKETGYNFFNCIFYHRVMV